MYALNSPIVRATVRRTSYAKAEIQHDVPDWYCRCYFCKSCVDAIYGLPTLNFKSEYLNILNIQNAPYFASLKVTRLSAAKMPMPYQVSSLSAHVCFVFYLHACRLTGGGHRSWWETNSCVDIVLSRAYNTRNQDVLRLISHSQFTKAPSMFSPFRRAWKSDSKLDAKVFLFHQNGPYDRCWLGDCIFLKFRSLRKCFDCRLVARSINL